MQLIDLYQFIISICIRLNYFFYIDLVQYGEKLYFVMIGLDNLYWLVVVIGLYGLWVWLG